MWTSENSPSRTFVHKGMKKGRGSYTPAPTLSGSTVAAQLHAPLADCTPSAQKSLQVKFLEASHLRMHTPAKRPGSPQQRLLTQTSVSPHSLVLLQNMRPREFGVQHG